MIERLLLSLIIVFFILAFAVKNIKTYLSTGNSIRGKSLKLTLSILLSSMIYVLLLLRLILDEAKWFVELDLLQDPIIRYVGYGLVFIVTRFIILFPLCKTFQPIEKPALH